MMVQQAAALAPVVLQVLGLLGLSSRPPSVVGVGSQQLRSSTNHGSSNSSSSSSSSSWVV
jgi:hypothetical protein